jgi:ABC-type multidrug transport system permease subunit
MLGIQAVIFGVWGNDGDPPDAVVAIAFVIFWSSVLVLLTVIVVAVRRRLALRHG